MTITSEKTTKTIHKQGLSELSPLRPLASILPAAKHPAGPAARPDRAHRGKQGLRQTWRPALLSRLHPSAGILAAASRGLGCWDGDSLRPGPPRISHKIMCKGRSEGSWPMVTAPGVFYKWNHPAGGLWGLALSPQHTSLEIHPGCLSTACSFSRPRTIPRRGCATALGICTVSSCS
ncbi:uncharacterized protein WM277_002784 isoform 1-T1 [Molossus nigricans]